MRAILRLASELGLCGFVVYLTLQNTLLRTQLSEVIMAIDAAPVACLLPPIKGAKTAGMPFDLDFPRQRAILMISTDKNCPYCVDAIENWAKLVKDFPFLDTVVYDPNSTYTNRDLESFAIPPSLVITAPLQVPPYPALLQRTPTVILIGRQGQVLGTWSGQLSAQRVNKISAALTALLT